jgi:hypothetical protein
VIAMNFFQMRIFFDDFFTTNRPKNDPQPKLQTVRQSVVYKICFDNGITCVLSCKLLKRLKKWFDHNLPQNQTGIVLFYAQSFAFVALTFYDKNCSQFIILFLVFRRSEYKERMCLRTKKAA